MNIEGQDGQHTKGRPPGRPSRFRRDFCDEIVEFCREGRSISEYADHIDVSRATLNNWAAQHAEFLEALSRAKAGALAWWARQARRVAEKGGGPGTSQVVVFALRNFGAEDYRDRRDAPLSIELPAITSARTAAEAISAAARAFAAGQIEAAQVSTVIELAGAYVKAAEFAELEARLDALEGRKH